MEERHLKCLLNDTSKVVEEQLEGLVALNPKELALLEGHNVVVRRAFIAGDHKDEHVALLSGGGSGHEPAHAGFVGEGLLTAAIAGNVFTSPSTASVLAALRTVTGKKGALLIVKNYTGDMLNFGMAAELARAEGLKVNMVIVADDCALSADLTKSAGRRGLAGTVLVHKAAGAAAEAGASLDEVTDIAQRVAQQVRTIGIALTPCIIPAVGKPSFTLPGNEVELGLGIHGEPGVERQSLQSADETVKQLMGHLLEDANLPEDTHVVLLVNNLGTTTSMELHIVCRAVVRFINKHTTLHLERLFCGPFMTALDMKGISISLLPLPREERLLEYLDAPCGRGTAWLPAARCSPLFTERVAAPTSTCDISGGEPEKDKTLSFTAAEAQHFWKLLQLLCEQLCQKETIDQLTALDQAAGDGDFGFSLEQGCKAISSQLVQLPVDKGPAATFHALGSILQSAMGGTSGMLLFVCLLVGLVD
ncbi:3,4-dihydroxy-2-butanone kinase [Balamuthia mandrillaris]